MLVWSWYEGVRVSLRDVFAISRSLLSKVFTLKKLFGRLIPFSLHFALVFVRFLGMLLYGVEMLPSLNCDRVVL